MRAISQVEFNEMLDEVNSICIQRHRQRQQAFYSWREMTNSHKILNNWSDKIILEEEAFAGFRITVKRLQIKTIDLSLFETLPSDQIQFSVEECKLDRIIFPDCKRAELKDLDSETTNNIDVNHKSGDIKINQCTPIQNLQMITVHDNIDPFYRKEKWDDIPPITCLSIIAYRIHLVLKTDFSNLEISGYLTRLDIQNARFRDAFIDAKIKQGVRIQYSKFSQLKLLDEVQSTKSFVSIDATYEDLFLLADIDKYEIYNSDISQFIINTREKHSRSNYIITSSNGNRISILILGPNIGSSIEIKGYQIGILNLSNSLNEFGRHFCGSIVIDDSFISNARVEECNFKTMSHFELRQTEIGDISRFPLTAELWPSSRSAHFLPKGKIWQANFRILCLSATKSQSGEAAQWFRTKEQEFRLANAKNFDVQFPLSIFGLTNFGQNWVTPLVLWFIGALIFLNFHLVAVAVDSQWQSTFLRSHGYEKLSNSSGLLLGAAFELTLFGCFPLFLSLNDHASLLQTFIALFHASFSTLFIFLTFFSLRTVVRMKL